MLLALILLACESPEPYDDILVNLASPSTEDAPSQNTWVEVPILSDLVWIAPETGLAIDVEQRALATFDLPTGRLRSSIDLSGTPHRMAWSTTQNLALVSQNEEGPPRILAVDPSTKTTQVIPLTFEGVSYPAYDVAWSQDESFAWVLGADPDGFLRNWLLKVNLESRAVESVHSLDTGFSGWHLAAADDDIYVGHERFDLADLSLEELPKVASYPKNVLDPHRLQLSADGSGTLWPDFDTLYERNRATAEITATYPHHDTWGIHGPEQWIYSSGDDRVFTLGVDFDIHQVQSFSRASGELEQTWNLSGPEDSRATFYDVEVMLTEPDDSRIYVYAHQDFVGGTGFIKWVDINE